jgi:rhodanese-related sulfurtransferase
MEFEMRLANAILCTALIISTCLLPVDGQADDYMSPDRIKGATTIDAEVLIEMASREKDLVIIDSRIASDRRQGYIADSISLPDTDTDCFSLARYIDRDSTPVVFYCNGPRCRRSDRAVAIARDCGYNNIYWFRGGLEEWKSRQYLLSK